MTAMLAIESSSETATVALAANRVGEAIGL